MQMPPPEISLRKASSVCILIDTKTCVIDFCARERVNMYLHELALLHILPPCLIRVFIAPQTPSSNGLSFECIGLHIGKGGPLTVSNIKLFVFIEMTPVEKDMKMYPWHYHLFESCLAAEAEFCKVDFAKKK